MTQQTPPPAPGVPSRTVQVLGSLAVAVVIVAVTVLLVTARIGADPDFLEDRNKDRFEQIEEQREARQELQEGQP